MVELTIIQANLKAPKNQTNHFGKYKYRSCEDILEGYIDSTKMFSLKIK